MFWELEKAIFGPEKDTWWIWGSKTPKPPELPIKLGKAPQHHNWPRYMDWPQIGPKVAIKHGKKRQKDKWYLFRAPTPPPSPSKNCKILPFVSFFRGNHRKKGPKEIDLVNFDGVGVSLKESTENFQRGKGMHHNLSDPNRSECESQIASNCNRSSKNHCDSENNCKAAMSLRFLREKPAISKLQLAIASDL